MEYINNYLKLSNAADEIIAQSGQAPARRAEGSSLVSRPQEKGGEMRLDDLDPESVVTGYLASIKDTFSQDEEIEQLKGFLEEEGLEVEEKTRPKSREDFYEETGLTEDSEFMSQLESLEEKYPGLSKSEVFRVIKGESAFNPNAVNKDTQASGLFQFIPKVAAELGFTPQDILSMAPAEQLKVYDMYLDKWDYSGKNSLGIMQAAPAYANASEDTVVYKKGSKAWEQNPGWRPSSGGDITVGSINNYYGRA